jgi:hypothetical protein
LCIFSVLAFSNQRARRSLAEIYLRGRKAEGFPQRKRPSREQFNKLPETKSEPRAVATGQKLNIRLATKSEPRAVATGQKLNIRLATKSKPRAVATGQKLNIRLATKSEPRALVTGLDSHAANVGRMPHTPSDQQGTGILASGITEHGWCAA